MIIPPQIYNQLHVLEIPTMDDVQNLIGNGKNPENIRQLYYWIQQIEKKAQLLGVFLTIWDDAIFLGAIEWDWFLQEHAFNNYLRARQSCGSR